MFLVVLLFLGRQSGRLCVRFIFAENYFSHFFQVPHSRQFASQHFTIFFFVCFHFYFLNFFSRSLLPSRVPQLTWIWMSGASGLGNLTTFTLLLLFQASFFLLFSLSYLLLNNAQQKTETFAIQENTKNTQYLIAQIYFFKDQLVNILFFINSEIWTTIDRPIFFSVLNPTFGASRPLTFVVVLSLSISCLNLLLEILPLLPARLHDRGDVLHAGESWGQGPDQHHEQN